MRTAETVRRCGARRLALAAAMAAVLAVAGVQAAWADAGYEALAPDSVAPGAAPRRAADDYGIATLSDEPEARIDFDDGTSSAEDTLDKCLYEASMHGVGACTITLLEDARFDGVDTGIGAYGFAFGGTASVTLDLNGHTATANRLVSFLLYDTARMIVKDSGSTGALVNGSGGGYPFFILGVRYGDAATLSIEGGAIDTGASRAVQASFSGSLTMTGGSIVSSGETVIGLWGGTVNISGGTVVSEGPREALYLNDDTCSASISGGVLKAKNYPAVTAFNGAKVNLSGSPKFAGYTSGEDEGDLYGQVGGSIIANDGAVTPAYYAGDPLNVRSADGVGAAIVSGTDAKHANLFRLVANDEGKGFVFDGTNLKLAAADDPAVVALAGLREALGEAPQNATDLRAAGKLRADMADDPALAMQLYLLSGDEQVTLDERVDALAAIDAFEAAVAALPKASDAGATAALEAAQKLYAAVPDKYRTEAFLTPASVKTLATFGKAVEDAKKPAPTPEPDAKLHPLPTGTSATELASTGDATPVAAATALLCLAAATAATAAIATAKHRRAQGACR